MGGRRGLLLWHAACSPVRAMTRSSPAGVVRGAALAALAFTLGCGSTNIGPLDEVCGEHAALTARAVLARVPVPMKGTFTYYAKGGSAAPAPTGFMLGVTYAGGTIECMPASHPPPGAGAPSRAAEIRLEVVVEARTADGVLAETGMSGALSGTEDFAELGASEPQAAIKGTFEPTLRGYARMTVAVGGTFAATESATGDMAEVGSNGVVGDVESAVVAPVGTWR